MPYPVYLACSHQATCFLPTHMHTHARTHTYTGMGTLATLPGRATVVVPPLCFCWTHWESPSQRAEVFPSAGGVTAGSHHSWWSSTKAREALGELHPVCSLGPRAFPVPLPALHLPYFPLILKRMQAMEMREARRRIPRMMQGMRSASSRDSLSSTFTITEGSGKNPKLERERNG